MISGLLMQEEDGARLVRHGTRRPVDEDALGGLHADVLEQPRVPVRQVDELHDLLALAHPADVVVAEAVEPPPRPPASTGLPSQKTSVPLATMQ